MEHKENKEGSFYEENKNDSSQNINEQINDCESGYITIGDYILDKEILPLIGRRKTENGEGEGSKKIITEIIKKYSEYKYNLGDVTDRILYNAFDQLEYLFWEAEKHKKFQIRHMSIQENSSRNILKKTRSKTKYKRILEGIEKETPCMFELLKKSDEKVIQAEFTNYKMKFNILMSPSCFDDSGSLIEGTSYRLEFDKQWTVMEKCPKSYSKGETSIHFGQLKTINSKYDVYLQSENLSSVLFVLGTAKRPKTGGVNVSLVKVNNYDDEVRINSNKELSYPEDRREIIATMKSDSKITNKSDNEKDPQILNTLEGGTDSEKSVKKGTSEKKGNGILSKVFSLWRHLFGREKLKTTKLASYNKSCISFGSKKEVSPSLKSKSEVSQAINSIILLEKRRGTTEKNKNFSSVSSISLLSVLGKQRQYRYKNKSFLPSDDISDIQY